MHRLVRYRLSLRNGPPLTDAEYDLLAAYLHRLWSEWATGEDAFAALFNLSPQLGKPLLPPITPRLKLLEVPTTFMFGEHDWVGSHFIEQIINKKVNPNLRAVEYLPYVGHQLTIEDVDQFHSRLLALLAQPVHSIDLPDASAARTEEERAEQRRHLRALPVPSAAPDPPEQG